MHPLVAPQVADWVMGLQVAELPPGLTAVQQGAQFQVQGAPEPAVVAAQVAEVFTLLQLSVPVPE